MGDAAGGPIPFFQRLTVRLTTGVILALLLIGLPFLIAFHRLLRTQQLEAMSEATSGLSRILVDGLRSAMLAGHPRLLDEAVRGLARQQGVERVTLLDHRGRVRVSSDPALEGRALNGERDGTCAVCHVGSLPPAASRTMLASTGDRRVFRAMSTIPNEPQCHACHDAAASSNGIVMIDVALESADQRFFAGIGSTVALGAVMVVLTIGLLAVLLRQMVHRPLREVVNASQRVARGELDARAEVPPVGEFSRLASHFNRMTDHLARSLRTVETQRRDLQAILDSVDDEIIVLDRDRRVVVANQAFLLKLSPADRDIAGQICPNVASPEGSCGVREPGGCPVGKVFRTGELNKGMAAGTAPDGHESTIEIHASPLRGPDGSVTHVVEVRRDISERRQMEASLAHSERLASLGLLASGLSHEINNPLGAIAASVDGLRRRLPAEPDLPAEARTALEAVLARIAQEVQRGRDITHRLLKVARPAGSARTLIDVNHTIEDTIAILAHHIRRSGIVTRFDLADRLPPLPGDESQLAQVLMNLVLNAIQAMEQGGGELRLVTRASNGAIEIEVEDTGCGISPEVLKRIYEPFFTTKPPGKGTGLGLFVTHRIVAEMGGTVQAHSQPGRGTTFSVRLPRPGEGGRA